MLYSSTTLKARHTTVHVITCGVVLNYYNLIIDTYSTMSMDSNQYRTIRLRPSDINVSQFVLDHLDDVTVYVDFIPPIKIMFFLMVLPVLDSLCSIIGAVRTGLYMVHVLTTNGFRQSVCDISFYSAPVSKFWAYAFVLSKAPELGKTSVISFFHSPKLQKPLKCLMV